MRGPTLRRARRARRDRHEDVREVGRPRGLPNGRAVVGGFLVALSAVLVFAAYRGTASGPSHRFVVARRDIAPGMAIARGDVELVTVDLPEPMASRAFADPDALLGRLTLAPIAKGELVQATVVMDRHRAPPGFQVSIPIERARGLDGAVQAGEVVDVLVTYAGSSDARTSVVARGAQVVRVDTSRSAIGSSGDLIIVLSVATEDAVVAVTHGSQAGKVTLVRAIGGADGAG